jgi:hypothetical protein
MPGCARNSPYSSIDPRCQDARAAAHIVGLYYWQCTSNNSIFIFRRIFIDLRNEKSLMEVRIFQAQNTNKQSTSAQRHAKVPKRANMWLFHGKPRRTRALSLMIRAIILFGQWYVHVGVTSAKHASYVKVWSNCPKSRILVRIRVRINPPHPLVCRKRRLNGGDPSEETGKTEVPCHSRCCTIKIPPCSKALSIEHRPKFCSPSPEMVTSPCKWKVLEGDVKL